MKIEIPAYHDVWMDNGIENLYKLLKNGQDDGFEITIDNNSLIITISNFDKFKESVGITIKNVIRSNLVVMKEDKKTGETKEVKKDYILIQERKKIGGKVAFKEELYNEDITMKTVKKILDLIAEEGTHTCILCGRYFSKPVKKLQQASYPFSTKIKSLSGVRSYRDNGVYSFKEYFENFCATCYLIGIGEWADDGIFYRTIPGKKSILFLPHFNNLQDLIKFKNSWRPLLNKTSRYCNIRVKKGREETENSYGSFSTLLCFYEKIFTDSGENPVIGNSWVIMEVPFGAVKNIKSNVMNIAEPVLQIIRELSSDTISIYKDIIKKVSCYDASKNMLHRDNTNEIRENISEAMLKDDFRYFARIFLPRKQCRIYCSNDTRKNLQSLIYTWRLKNMGLNEEELKTIKSAGRTIATVSKDHRNLLYSIDKAKDKSSLLDALRQVSRRITGLKDDEKRRYNKFIYPPSLEDIVSMLEKHDADKKFIDDIKNTLVIFACVEFSRLDYVKEKEDETNERI